MWNHFAKYGVQNTADQISKEGDFKVIRKLTKFCSAWNYGLMLKLHFFKYFTDRRIPNLARVILVKPLKKIILTFWPVMPGTLKSRLLHVWSGLDFSKGIPCKNVLLYALWRAVSSWFYGHFWRFRDHFGSEKRFWLSKNAAGNRTTFIFTGWKVAFSVDWPFKTNS